MYGDCGRKTEVEELKTGKLVVWTFDGQSTVPPLCFFLETRQRQPKLTKKILLCLRLLTRWHMNKATELVVLFQLSQDSHLCVLCLIVCVRVLVHFHFNLVSFVK